MSARAWRWIVVCALIATAVIGVAGAIDIVGRAVKVFRPESPPVECQKSKSCRAFVHTEIHQAVAELADDLRQGGGHQSGQAPGQQPGPPSGGSGEQGGGSGGSDGGAQDGLPGPPGPPGPPGQPPPDQPGLLDPVCDLVPPPVPQLC